MALKPILKTKVDELFLRWLSDAEVQVGLLDKMSQYLSFIKRYNKVSTKGPKFVKLSVKSISSFCPAGNYFYIFILKSCKSKTTLTKY